MSTKRNSKKPDAYIVVYDDGDTCFPMGQDKDCDGALSVASDLVCLFADKASARCCINISRRYFELCRAQGKPANDDFSPAFISSVKIVPCLNFKHGAAA